MDYEAFLLNLCELFIVDDDNDMVDEALIQWIVKMGEPSIYSIQMMKDRGNSLFKEGNLSLASSLYKQALNVFCFLGLPSAHSQPASSSLALSLVLNLAACELKLSRYSQAWCFCNFVLDFDPSNVKALYRRGLALRNLHFYVEALGDFEHALKLEPNNKDVCRELNSIADSLALNPNGKRVAFQFDPLGTDRKGKKPLLNVDVDTKLKTLDKVVDEASCSRVHLENSEMSYDYDTSHQSPVTIMDSDSNNGTYPPLPSQCASKPSVPKPSNYSFFNKNQSRKSLYLSSKDYENLMSGRNLQFYHSKSGAYMKVRPLSKTSILTGTPHEKFSWEAEVPSFSPLILRPSTSMEFRPSEDLGKSGDKVVHRLNVKRASLSNTVSSSNSTMVCEVAALDNASTKVIKFDDEEANCHEVKKPRLSPEKISDPISEVSNVSLSEDTSLDLDQPVKVGSYPLPCQSQFVFSSSGKSLSRAVCSKFVGISTSRHCSSRVQTKVKNNSLLRVRRSSIFCRFTGDQERGACSKRKDDGSFQLDHLLPYKKCRLCVDINSVCNISYVSCAFASSWVSSGPQFVW